MPELDTLLRRYFDEIAPPVDVEGEIAVRSRKRRAARPTMRHRLAVAGIAAAVTLLVVGLVSVLLGRWWEAPVVEEPAQPLLEPTRARRREPTREHRR